MPTPGQKAAAKRSRNRKVEAERSKYFKWKREIWDTYKAETKEYEDHYEAAMLPFRIAAEEAESRLIQAMREYEAPERLEKAKHAAAEKRLIATAQIEPLGGGWR